MIRTNLSTRPFYNARAVRALLGLFAAIVVIATVYNVVQLVRLTSSQRTLGAKAEAAERESERLRREAVQTLGRVDQKELAVVGKAAAEANTIIDQRTFSWTDVLTHFERTLHRIDFLPLGASGKPRLVRDFFLVTYSVEA